MLLEYLLFSTSRWVSSHHQRVEIGNDGHECICFQTCNHDTRDDVDNHTTIFLHLALPPIDKGFLAPVAGLASRLFELFTSVLGEIFLRLPLLPAMSHCLPWHACVENYKCLFLNKTQMSSAENILQSSARCKNVAPFLLSRLHAL